MSARNRMVHRAATERDVAGLQRDLYNHPITSAQPVLTRQPCYWQQSMESRINDDEILITIARHTIFAPLDADMIEGDRITSIRDRRDRVLQGLSLRVRTIVQRADHLEISAEGYT